MSDGKAFNREMAAFAYDTILPKIRTLLELGESDHSLSCKTAYELAKTAMPVLRKHHPQLDQPNPLMDMLLVSDLMKLIPKRFDINKLSLGLWALMMLVYQAVFSLVGKDWEECEFYRLTNSPSLNSRMLNQITLELEELL